MNQQEISNEDFLKGLNFDYTNPDGLEKELKSQLEPSAQKSATTMGLSGAGSSLLSGYMKSNNVDFLGHIDELGKSNIEPEVKLPMSPESVKKIHINQVRWNNPEYIKVQEKTE